MIPAQNVVDSARLWLGTPYRHQARVRMIAVDCIGLVIGVGRDLGIFAEGFDYTDYSRLPHGGVLQREVERHCIPIPLSDKSPGCILLMKWKGEPQHAAIYTGPTIIHSASTFKKVVEHTYSGKWMERTVAAYQLPGVSYV